MTLSYSWRPGGGDSEPDDLHAVPLDAVVEARIDLVCEGRDLDSPADPYSVMRCLRWLLLDPLERD